MIRAVPFVGVRSTDDQLRPTLVRLLRLPARALRRAPVGVCYPRHLAEAAGSGFSRVGLRVGIISFKRIGGPEIAHDRFRSATRTFTNANAS